MKKPYVPKIYRRLYKKNAIGRVLEVLFKFPDKEFSLSELAELSSVAKANMGKILEELDKDDFIEIVKLSKIWRIRANQRNVNFTRSKVIYNLNFVYLSGLIDFLAEYYKNPKAIILFGSFRKGEDVFSSDIDIAVETDSGYGIMRLKELSGFENELMRKIQIHLFNRKNVDINLFNNIANGILLYGFLEVKP